MTVRVLVCDDHPVVRDALSACVRTLAPDCEVAECGTAATALERLAEPRSWDLLLLDLLLPDARGIEALQRLRGAAPSTRIVVMSALDDRMTVERAIRAGAIAFVPKTVDRDSLMRSLRAWLPVEAPAAHEKPSDGDAGGDANGGSASRSESAGRVAGKAGGRSAGGTRSASRASPDGAVDDHRIHDGLASLSPRRIQVLRLMARGLPNKEICATLGLSENTIKIHIGAVLRALHARNRTEAVAHASRVGFGGR